jgi:hypothetical protein
VCVQLSIWLGKLGVSCCCEGTCRIELGFGEEGVLNKNRICELGKFFKFNFSKEDKRGGWSE